MKKILFLYLTIYHVLFSSPNMTLVMLLIDYYNLYLTYLSSYQLLLKLIRFAPRQRYAAATAAARRLPAYGVRRLCSVSVAAVSRSGYAEKLDVS